jgi:hypothetical protein
MVNSSVPVEMLVYMLMMSRKASLRFRSYGISCTSLMSWEKFYVFYVYGSEVYVCSSLVSILATL